MSRIIFNPSLDSYVFGPNLYKDSNKSKEEEIGKSIFYLLIYGLIIMVSVLLPIGVFIVETMLFDFLNFSSTILMSVNLMPLTIFDIIFLPIFIFYQLHKKVSSF